MAQVSGIRSARFEPTCSKEREFESRSCHGFWTFVTLLSRCGSGFFMFLKFYSKGRGLGKRW
jgi:hypothetical protein